MPKQLLEKVQITSYGVEIGLESDDPALLGQALERARKSLLNKLEIVTYASPEHVLGLYTDNDGVFILRHGGEDERHGEDREYFLRFFDTWLRLTVSEYAKNRVFLHSGAVAWRGKGIIFPGHSHAGKSTLTAALVEAGATYYSDEYAIHDKDALLHPFPRPIALRQRDAPEFQEIELGKFGFPVGTNPLRVGCVLFTRFEPTSIWEPTFPTPGAAILELVSHTAPIRYKTNFSLKVLKTLVSNAILIKSDRYDVGHFVGRLLDFIDNSAF